MLNFKKKKIKIPYNKKNNYNFYYKFGNLIQIKINL